MADIAIAIEKGTDFQGGQEVFSNVYTFNVDPLSGFDDVATIDRLVQIEKNVFGNSVSFLKASSYSIGGLQATNVMREIKDLSGTGTQTAAAIYKECAILVNFQLPRSAILRRRRIGRKWLHVGNTSVPVSWPAGADKGTALLGTALKDWYRNQYALLLVNEPWTGGATFGSHGDQFTEPWIGDYLEHRQFHR